MTTPDLTTEPRRLRDLDEIAAAGAEAVRDFHLSDEQCEQLAACVADAVPAAEDEGDAARRRVANRTQGRRAAA